MKIDISLCECHKLVSTNCNSGLNLDIVDKKNSLSPYVGLDFEWLIVT